MKILKKLRTAITATMLTLSTSSCMQKAGGYVDMPENLIEPAVREVVDRVAAKTREFVPDSTYKCFHKDTLYFHKDLIKKKGDSYMLDRLHDNAIQAVDSTTHEKIPVVVPKKKIGAFTSCLHINDNSCSSSSIIIISAKFNEDLSIIS